MAWIALTETDLNETTGELAAVKGVLLPEGRTASQVIAEELTQGINYARGFCPAGVSLDSGVTIPDALKKQVLAIVRVSVFTRIQALNRFLTEPRMKEAETAERTLREWQKGVFRVLATDTPADAQPVTPSGAITFLQPSPRGRLGSL